MKPLFIGIIFLLFLSLIGEGQSFSEGAKGDFTEDIQKHLLIEEILLLVNEIRLKNNLNALQLSEGLALAANYHAKDMAVDNYMEHESYDRKRNRLRKACGTFERIRRFIELPYLGENIAAGKSTAKETMDDWMKSKTHRQNILNENFKYIGIGYHTNKKSRYIHYWVQYFGG